MISTASILHTEQENDEPMEDSKDCSRGFMQREAMRMSRNPKTYFWASFVVAVVLSVIGIYCGGFTVAVDTKGWSSRGTLVANRQVQLQLVRNNRQGLLHGDKTYWDDLTGNTQEWLRDDGRRLSSAEELQDTTVAEESFSQRMTFLKDPGPLISRRLQEDNSDIWERCDTGIYTDPEFPLRSRLWPVWKTKHSESSALDPQVLHDICVAEENTQKVLIENDLCYGCEDGGCLPPYSVVLFARLVVNGGFVMDCPALAEAWGPHQEATEQNLRACVDHLRTVKLGSNDTGPCPSIFTAALVDGNFDNTGIVSYTSSIFVTKNDKVDELYQVSDAFDRGDGQIEGVYDTQKEEFVIFYANEAIVRDMLLAIGSALSKFRF
jgi:hypothetical protein